MSVISLYSTNPEVMKTLLEVLNHLDQEGPEPVRTELFESFSDFLDSGRRNPRRILILAQQGTGSVELAAATVEECPLSPMIWLSDLDFALFSYRLEVDHFALLPGTEETMRVALMNCRKRHLKTPVLSALSPKREAKPVSLWQKLWNDMMRLLGKSG